MEYITYNTGTRALPDIYALALGRRAYVSGKVLLPVATNLQTGLDLRTGPYCCENTNLRTGLDQWTRQSMARGHGYN